MSPDLQQMVDAALADAARISSHPPLAPLQVVQAAGVTWPDGSLGDLSRAR